MDRIDTHDRKVAAVAAAVRELAARGAVGRSAPAPGARAASRSRHQAAHVLKGGVHHVVPLPDDRRFAGRPIDISSLRDVLAIDLESRTCRAEPGVTFAEVLSATLHHGLIPTVVPELEGITLGGAVAGCSVESMSFRHGGFHDSCLEYEVVTGRGEVLTCSREHEPLAFEMIHGSYGTLGVLTALRFRLVPAKPFVHITYQRFSTVERFSAALRERCASAGLERRRAAPESARSCRDQQDDVDFIDAIVHGPDRFVLCLGRLVDQATYTSDYRRLNVYYKSTAERREDYLTVADYCFRYDTECHWLTRTFPPLEWWPVRLAVGPFFLGSTNLIRWSKRLEPLLGLKRRPDVVCDYFIPAARFEEFWSWYARTVRYYPLWAVPYRIPTAYPWVSPRHATQMQGSLFIDCAVYGRPNGETDQDYSQLLEERTYALGGIKTLISRNHHTRERFWQIYNRESYEAAKSRLDPDGLFGNLYDKMHG